MKKILTHIKENWIRYGFETLVVIVGVLIAFALNDWNEAGKRKVVETELLKSLKTDLERTLFDVKEDFDNHLISQNSGNKFKRFLLGENMLEDSIVLNFISLSQDRHFFPNSSGYVAFKSSEVDLISNDSLRMMITELFELTFPRIKEWDESNPRWDIGIVLHPYYKKHFILTDEIVDNNVIDYRFPVYKFRLKSLDEIRGDNDLQIDLQETFQMRSRKIQLNSVGIDKIEWVLSNLNKELER